MLRKSDDNDALKRPAFGTISKIQRLLWNIIRLLLFKPSPVVCHSWRCFLLRSLGATIGKSNFIYPDVTIWAPWLLETEDVVTLGPRSEIYNPGGVKLGHHTIISQDSYLCGATHDYNSKNFTYISRKIQTGPYVWICARATVLPGVFAEEGSVLGAASVTSKRMKAWTVYAGNPAVEVKKRQWKGDTN